MRFENMGLTYVSVKIFGKLGERELRVIADTGSTFTWIATESLEKIGVQPKGQRKFRTIEGREISRKIGEALIEVMGERATSIVVFAEGSDAQVLGAYSLQGLGLEVDPTTKQLKKVEAFIAY